MADSAVTEIFKLATIRLNTGRSATIEQAVDQVCQEYPELYVKDYAERTGGGHFQAPLRRAPVPAPRPSGAYGEMQRLALAKVASGAAKTVEQGIDQVVCERSDLYKRYVDERAGRAEPVAIQKGSLPLYTRPTGPPPAAKGFLVKACSRALIAKGLTAAQAEQCVVAQYPWLG